MTKSFSRYYSKLNCVAKYHESKTEKGMTHYLVILITAYLTIIHRRRSKYWGIFTEPKLY